MTGMAATDPERRLLSARVAAIERHNGGDDPRVAGLRAELKAAALRDQIRRDVASWPPLTAAVRAELALLLAGDGDAPAT
jgi:hypothetical protein